MPTNLTDTEMQNIYSEVTHLLVAKLTHLMLPPGLRNLCTLDNKKKNTSTNTKENMANTESFSKAQVDYQD